MSAWVCVAAIASDLAIICGTAYIVFWLGHSGWWFVLAALFLTSIKLKDTKP